MNKCFIKSILSYKYLVKLLFTGWMYVVLLILNVTKMTQ